METQKRVEYGGMMGKFHSVMSTGENHLECFKCHDESLYHDAVAYWNEETDDLLCPMCYGRSPDDKYIKVLTQH